MLLPSLLALLLGACFPLLSQAQGGGKTDARPVTTVRTTITVVPIAPTPAVYPALSAVPVAYIPLNSTSETNSTQPDWSAPTEDIANKFFTSGTFTPRSYVTSYPNASNTPAFLLPKPYYTNFTLPNATHPANTSLPLNNTCSIENPTCPACNNQTLVDRHNVTYTVLCGYSLDATLDYAFGEPLPAAYCMSRCDERNTTCVGASWSTQECVLALGSLVGKIKDPDHMAFLRVGIPPALSTGALPRPPISTGLSYSNVSRYPEASFTSVPKPTFSLVPAVSSVVTTSTRGPLPTVTVTITGSPPEPTVAPEPEETAVTVTVYTGGPSTAVPVVGGRPPWAGGDNGVDKGSRHHGRPGSSWRGGRPPWFQWDWKVSVWDSKDDQKHH